MASGHRPSPSPFPPPEETVNPSQPLPDDANQTIAAHPPNLSTKLQSLQHQSTNYTFVGSQKIQLDSCSPIYGTANRPSVVGLKLAHFAASSTTLPFTYQETPQVIFQKSDKAKLLAGMKHVLIAKFSHGRPSVMMMQTFLSNRKIIGKTHVSIFDAKHIFIEFEMFEDFTKFWIKQNGIINGFPVRFFKWNELFDPHKESSITPVWIHLPQLPLFFFEEGALLLIASALGRPLHIDGNNLNRNKISYATICIEFDVLQAPPSEVWIQFGEGTCAGKQTGSYEGFWQKIVYGFMPPFCTYCCHIGHLSSSCKRVKARVAVKGMGDECNALPICSPLASNDRGMQGRDELNKGMEKERLGLHSSSAATTSGIEQAFDLLEEGELDERLEHGGSVTKDHVSGGSVAEEIFAGLIVGNKSAAAGITLDYPLPQQNLSAKDTGQTADLDDQTKRKTDMGWVPFKHDLQHHLTHVLQQPMSSNSHGFTSTDLPEQTGGKGLKQLHGMLANSFVEIATVEGSYSLVDDTSKAAQEMFEPQPAQGRDREQSCTTSTKKEQVADLLKPVDGSAQDAIEEALMDTTKKQIITTSWEAAESQETAAESVPDQCVLDTNCSSFAGAAVGEQDNHTVAAGGDSTAPEPAVLVDTREQAKDSAPAGSKIEVRADSWAETKNAGVLAKAKAGSSWADLVEEEKQAKQGHEEALQELNKNSLATLEEEVLVEDITLEEGELVEPNVNPTDRLDPGGPSKQQLEWSTIEGFAMEEIEMLMASPTRMDPVFTITVPNLNNEAILDLEGTPVLCSEVIRKSSRIADVRKHFQFLSNEKLVAAMVEEGKYEDFIMDAMKAYTKEIHRSFLEQEKSIYPKDSATEKVTSMTQEVIPKVSTMDEKEWTTPKRRGKNRNRPK